MPTYNDPNLGRIFFNQTLMKIILRANIFFNAFICVMGRWVSDLLCRQW